MTSLLVEIGVEELPSRDVARASEALAGGLGRTLARLGLGGTAPRAFGTPRRLGVLVEDVADVQQLAPKEVRGPSRERAYDAAGAPTPALLGFCRGHAIGPDEVRVEETPQGAYVMATIAAGGRPAAEVLPSRLASLFAEIPFSRTMRWGEGALRFGRPVVWLVALLGRDVLDLEFAGARAGRESRGHRFLAPGPVALGEAGDYAERLEAAFVLADRDVRRERVRAAVESAAAAEALVAEVPAALLDEVTDLVEWPTAFVGRFPERFLALPDAALTTPIVHHQRQFPVRWPDGARASAFVGVRNGGDRRMDLVRHGNEGVLQARLADALFFYERDRADGLAAMRRGLAGLELGDGIGTLLDRAERVEAVSLRLAEAAGGDAAMVGRIAHLALCDRASHMVGEFPELAGVMGAAYAGTAGEPGAVVEGLGEAIHPRDSEDRLPRPGPGRLVALALRAEELVGGFAAGRAPTGSEDPYGLRRAGLALVRTGLEGGVPGGLLALLDAAAESLAGAFGERAREAARAVGAFLAERVEGILVDGGAAVTVAQAVCAGGIDRLETLRDRAAALAAFLEGEQADGLITAYRRAARIVEQARARADGVDPEADWRTWPAATDADRELVAAVRAATEADAGVAGSAGLAAHFARVASLTGPLDRFFREVMVMDPDPAVRAHRLAVLGAVVELASAHADLSRIGRRREEPVGA